MLVQSFRCLVLVIALAASGASAQDANSYVPDAGGQFAGMTGTEILEIGDRMFAKAKSAVKQGDWQSAFEALSVSSRMRGKVFKETHPLVLSTDQALGEAAEKIGNLHEARNNFNDVLNRRTRLLGANHRDTLTSLASHVGLLVIDGHFEAAEAILKSALDRASEELGFNDPVTTDLYRLYGDVLIDKGDLKEAKEIYSEVLTQREKATVPSGYLIAESARELASIFVLLEQFSEAEPLAERAFRALEDINIASSIELAESEATYADARLGLGQFDAAEKHYRSAIERLADSFHPLNRVINAKLAWALMQQPERRHLALVPLRIVTGAIRTELNEAGASRVDPDFQGTIFDGGLSKIWRGADEREPFRMMLDALYAETLEQSGAAVTKEEPLSFRAEAFRAMLDSFDSTPDKAVISAIGRSVAPDRVKIIRGREILLEQRYKLKADYVAALGAGNPNVEQLSMDIQKNLHSIFEVDREIEKKIPDYFDFLKPKKLSVSDLPDVLEEKEAMLIIVPTRSSTHIFFHSKEHGQKWIQSSVSQIEIEAAVRRLLWDVGAPNNASVSEINNWESEMEGDGAYPFSFRTANFLYEELFSKFEEQLKDARHIFVVANGPLASLPMGMLVSEVPGGKSGDPEVLRSAKWLSNRFAFTILPTVQTLQFLRNHRNKPPKDDISPFIGIGDPALHGKAVTRGRLAQTRRGTTQVNSFDSVFRGASSESGEILADRDSLLSMARLPGTAVELTQLWESFGKPINSLYLSERATEGFVKSTPIKANVVAFATHGLLAGEIGRNAEPGLVLTPPGRSSKNDDGFLTSSEIAALNLDVEWVILSACNTAAGDGSNGAAGLSGLARSFFFAGARNLLVSHWPVRDDVAARLTVRTVQLTQNGQAISRAEALRQAMLEIRNDQKGDTLNDTWAHPNAWAPFSLVGDGSVSQ